MANQVLNYHDAVIYDTDVGLFGDGGWLNDNCINWFFRCDRFCPNPMHAIYYTKAAQQTNGRVDERSAC